MLLPYDFHSFNFATCCSIVKFTLELGRCTRILFIFFANRLIIPSFAKWKYPLEIAASRGRVEIAKLLLSHPNINPNLRSAVNGDVIYFIPYQNAYYNPALCQVWFQCAGIFLREAKTRCCYFDVGAWEIWQKRSPSGLFSPFLPNLFVWKNSDWSRL